MKSKFQLRLNDLAVNYHLALADSFTTRLRGLMFRRAIPPNIGLLIPSCNAVHCVGMLFAIDVIFLSKDHSVIQINEHLRPFLMAMNLRAHHVIEMTSGSVKRLNIKTGDRITWE